MLSSYLYQIYHNAFIIFISNLPQCFHHIYIKSTTMLSSYLYQIHHNAFIIFISNLPQCFHHIYIKSTTMLSSYLYQIYHNAFIIFISNLPQFALHQEHHKMFYFKSTSMNLHQTYHSIFKSNPQIYTICTLPFIDFIPIINFFQSYRPF
jgi:hypothetical protein